MSFDSGQTKRARFAFIDGLRGIACLAVVFAHAMKSGELDVAMRALFPPPLYWLVFQGTHGVDIFFVISGFVIAHSLRNFSPDLRSVGRFVLRRQLRLDPPYWAVVFCVLALWAIERAMPFLVTEPLPAARTVMLNLFYLQNLTSVRNLIIPAWTLCIEIQFYLVFVVILFACLKFLQYRRFSWLAGAVWIVALCSIWMDRSSPAAWFVADWCLFGSGVLLCLTVSRLIHPAWLSSLVAVGCIRSILLPRADIIAGLATVAVIYFVAKREMLATASLGAPIQYFGRISYSLYLVNLTVSQYIHKLGFKLTGSTAMGAALWWIAIVVISIASAHLLHFLVERPSLELSNYLRNERSEKSPTTHRPAHDEAVPLPVTP